MLSIPRAGQIATEWQERVIHWPLSSLALNEGDPGSVFILSFTLRHIATLGVSASKHLVLSLKDKNRERYPPSKYDCC